MLIVRLKNLPASYSKFIKVIIVVLIIFTDIAVFNIFAANQNLQKKMQRSEFVPQWAKSAIWYQIFPERFRDGDPTNNPTIADLAGSDPEQPPAFWNIHPWGSDWYQLQPYEKENGEPELWKHLLRRRYGGDLQGIIDKLDYLQKLGVNSIYLNPIFDSPSLHKYDGASYHHIDPNFGPDPIGDRLLVSKEDPTIPSTWVWTKADRLMLKLISELHKRKMKIIFDGVFNHLGRTSFAFKDLKKNQAKSKYANWFNVTSFRDSKSHTPFSYEGWFGVKSLPVWKEDDNGIVDGPRQYIFAATKRWMNPEGKGIENGIDGWRLDVAYEVKHKFWKAWRKHVKSINPQAYLTAEIVDTPDKVKPYFQGDEFDGEMNYNFAFTLSEFLFNPTNARILPSELDKELKKLRNMYPKGVAYVTQNLFDSHDSNRIGSHIVNRGIGRYRDWGKYFALSQAANNLNYKTRKPNSDEINLQKLFVIFQMTYVGAPMIYYGDEVGMWGANDPDSRKPMLWPDMEYQNETYLADGSKRNEENADKVEINESLLNFYQKLIHIRKKHPALRLGSFKSILVDDKKELFGFVRKYQGENIRVFLNNSFDEQIVKFVPESNSNSYLDLVSGKVIATDEKTAIFSLLGKQGAIIVSKPID